MTTPGSTTASRFVASTSRIRFRRVSAISTPAVRQRATRQARAGTARHERDLLTGEEPNDGDELVPGAGEHRHAGIAAVRGQPVLGVGGALRGRSPHVCGRPTILASESTTAGSIMKPVDVGMRSAAAVPLSPSPHDGALLRLSGQRPQQPGELAQAAGGAVADEQCLLGRCLELEGRSDVERQLRGIDRELDRLCEIALGEGARASVSCRKPSRTSAASVSASPATTGSSSNSSTRASR